MTRRALSTVLLVGVLGILCVGGLGIARHFSAPSRFSDTVPELDSFSEPQIAIAILNQHAQNIFWTYCNLTEPSCQPVRLQQVDQIRSLYNQVQTLNQNLTSELMLIYAESGDWKEFLDCYLKLLSEAPDPNEYGLVLWTPCALEHSGDCGRTEEVLEALRQVMLSHEDVKSVRRLAGTVEKWKAEHQYAAFHPRAVSTLSMP